MNPALAARIIAQNTAMANQNAAGQAGILRAQQQLAAQQGLANVYGQQAGENLTQLGQLTAAQAAANQTNAQTAAQNSQLGGGLVGGVLGAVGNLFSEGGEVTPAKHLERLLISTGDKVKPLHLADGGSLFGNSMIPQYTPQASSYIPTAMPRMSALDSMSGVGSNIGSNAASIFGGFLSPSEKAAPLQGATSLGANSSYNPNLTTMGNQLSGNPGRAAGNAGMAGPDMGINPNDTNQTITQGDTSYQNAAKGGMVKAMVSPGERYIPPHLVDSVRKGKMLASRAAPKVPGKAKVKGDSETNDIVPAELESGGVVIPRTKADNDKDAREFLLAIQKEKAKKDAPTGYTRVLAARRKNA